MLPDKFVQELHVSILYFYILDMYVFSSDDEYKNIYIDISLFYYINLCFPLIYLSLMNQKHVCISDGYMLEINVMLN